MSCRHWSYRLNRISYLPPPTLSPTRSIKCSLSLSLSLSISSLRSYTHTHVYVYTLAVSFVLSLSIHIHIYIYVCIRYVCVACRGIVLINQRPCARKRISLQYCNLNQQMQIIFLYIYSCVRCGYLFDFVIACHSLVSSRFFSLFPCSVRSIYLTILYTYYYVFICTPTAEKRAPLVSAACVCVCKIALDVIRKRQNVVINTRFSNPLIAYTYLWQKKNPPRTFHTSRTPQNNIT